MLGTLKKGEGPKTLARLQARGALSPVRGKGAEIVDQRVDVRVEKRGVLRDRGFVGKKGQYDNGTRRSTGNCNTWGNKQDSLTLKTKERDSSGARKSAITAEEKKVFYGEKHDQEIINQQKSSRKQPQKRKHQP